MLVRGKGVGTSLELSTWKMITNSIVNTKHQLKIKLSAQKKNHQVSYKCVCGKKLICLTIFVKQECIVSCNPLCSSLYNFEKKKKCKNINVKCVSLNQPNLTIIQAK